MRSVLRVAGCLLLSLALVACDDGAPPEPKPAGPPAQPESALLRLAGTGALTPLASVWARAWTSEAQQPRVVVEPSIGSGGGVRAVAEGAVDVGLIARPLSANELKRDLVLIPVARDAVVLAAHPSVAVDQLTSEVLLELFTGSRTSLGEATVTVFLRDREDTAHSAFERLVPSLLGPREAAYQTHRFRVLLHEDAMGEALSITPGALGLFSYGSLVAGHLPLKVLALDGVRPSLETLENGSWRASRDLGFVVRKDRLARVRGFLSYVSSAEASALARANGFLPLPVVVP